MKKFENLGRMLSKAEQKLIFGGDILIENEGCGNIGQTVYAFECCSVPGRYVNLFGCVLVSCCCCMSYIGTYCC